jgi:hypothetical protein
MDQFAGEIDTVFQIVVGGGGESGGNQILCPVQVCGRRGRVNSV